MIELNKVYNGDCLDIVANSTVRIDHVITDPPYDMITGDERLSMIFHYCDGNKILFCKPENQYGITADEYLFWVKTPSTKNFTKKCGRFVEMIMVCRGVSPVFNVLHWSQMTGVYDDRLFYSPKHPYEKPLSLIERLISIYTNPGDTILDPFSGSGTVGVACKKLGRNFILIEKDRDYYNLAEERLSSMGW